DRVRMEGRVPGETLVTEGPEGIARNMALRWFTETQAPVIIRDGNLPTWFLGLISRKDAEDQLRDKPLGCFLIRLSDKAIGYILSYKGRDRCRHFVINQNKAGQLIVSGDTETHNSLIDLIDYYRTSPIEPFGEYLTSSCYEPPQNELYDVVQVYPKEKPCVSVQAMKTIWDKRSSQAVGQPPVLPPKSGRKLTVSTSLDKSPLPQVNEASVPRRGTSDDKSPPSGQMVYAPVEADRPKEKSQAVLTSKGSLDRSTAEHRNECVEPKVEDLHTVSRNYLQDRETTQAMSRPGPQPGSVYSELSLVDCRSQSLPVLDDCTTEQHSYRQNSTSDTPSTLSPKPMKKATCHTVSLVDQWDHARQPASSGLPSSSSLDKLCSDSLYQLVGTGQWGSPNHSQAGTESTWTPMPTNGQEGRVYAQVPLELMSSDEQADKVYEQIPDKDFFNNPEASSSHNTYETLEELKQKGPAGGKM
ncbi:SH2 domain-containing protein 7-like, partial [Scleropages formosus]